MLDGLSAVAALKECGVTDVVWVPDSELGTWERPLLAEPSIRLIRVCREGEAIAWPPGCCSAGGGRSSSCSVPAFSRPATPCGMSFTI